MDQSAALKEKVSQYQQGAAENISISLSVQLSDKDTVNNLNHNDGEKVRGREIMVMDEKAG